jgi:hypothetical protein
MKTDIHGNQYNPSVADRYYSSLSTLYTHEAFSCTRDNPTEYGQDTTTNDIDSDNI